MNVWVVGNDGTILTTTDGGAWRSQDAGTSHHLAGVAFADADHGWIVGLTRESAIILATTDGGRHWQAQLSLPQIRLCAVACIGRDLVWAAGDRGVDDGLILASSDGGASWQEQLAPPAGACATSPSPMHCAAGLPPSMETTGTPDTCCTPPTAAAAGRQANAWRCASRASPCRALTSAGPQVLADFPLTVSRLASWSPTAAE